MILSQYSEALRTFFMHLTKGKENYTSAACVGFEIGLELVMTHPEYARAFYLALKKEDEDAWTEPEHMATGLVEMFPIQILEEVEI